MFDTNEMETASSRGELISESNRSGSRNRLKRMKLEVRGDKLKTLGRVGQMKERYLGVLGSWPPLKGKIWSLNLL